MGDVGKALDVGKLQLLLLLRSETAIVVVLSPSAGLSAVAQLIRLLSRRCCIARVATKVLDATRKSARGGVLLVCLSRRADGRLDVVIVDHALVEAETAIHGEALLPARRETRGIQNRLCGGRRGELHGVFEHVRELCCPWGESVLARAALRGVDRGGETMVSWGLRAVIELVPGAGLENWREMRSPQVLFAHGRRRHIECHQTGWACCCPAGRTGIDEGLDGGELGGRVMVATPEEPRCIGGVREVKRSQQKK